MLADAAFSMLRIRDHLCFPLLQLARHVDDCADDVVVLLFGILQTHTHARTHTDSVRCVESYHKNIRFDVC